MKLPETVGFSQNAATAGNPVTTWYKFHREEILISVLQKFATRSTHQELALNPTFGSSSSQWLKGFRGLVLYLDVKFYYLIEPEAIRNWVPWFDRFSKVMHGKWWTSGSIKTCQPLMNSNG
jgi:hypothetical protein